MVGKKIKVLSVDDHRLLLEGIAAVLAGEEDIELAAQATNGQEAIECFRMHRPDVTLMDVQMPGITASMQFWQYAQSFPRPVHRPHHLSGDVQLFARSSRHRLPSEK